MKPLSGYTFENFKVSDTNRFAYAAAKAVAEKPGCVYNPVILYGNTGAGKTHLLNAIYDRIRVLSLDVDVLKLSFDELVREMTSAILAEQKDLWYSELQSHNVLLVDDIDFLSGKNETQKEFVALLRVLVENGTQVVLTSLKPPSELPILDAGLRKGFDLALYADIQPPDP